MMTIIHDCICCKSRFCDSASDDNMIDSVLCLRKLNYLKFLDDVI